MRDISVALVFDYYTTLLGRRPAPRPFCVDTRRSGLLTLAGSARSSAMRTKRRKRPRRSRSPRPTGKPTKSDVG